MSPKLTERVWYQTTVKGAPAHAPLTGDEKADVAIIGGGTTGLSAALRLAQAGAKVIVCEKDSIADGPSGRNGGQVLPGLNSDIYELAPLLGEKETKAVWHLIEETRAKVVERALAEKCDYRQGILYAAMGPRQMKNIRDNAKDLTRNYGYKHAKLLDKAAVEKHVKSPAYVGGLYYADAGHFNPAKYTLALARQAVAAGVRICEHTPVLGWKGKTLMTPKGTIKAKHVIFAAGADQTWATTDFIRVTTGMVATAPLPPEVINQVLPGEAAVNDGRMFLSYMRKTPDNRILFGGGDALGEVSMKADRARLLAEMEKLYPALEGKVKITHHWRGGIDVSRTLLPGVLEQKKGVYRAYGLSGHGITFSHVAGEAMAEAILGQRDKLKTLEALRPPAFSSSRLIALAQIGLSLLPTYLNEKAGRF